jgi:hypothetical protein
VLFPSGAIISISRTNAPLGTERELWKGLKPSSYSFGAFCVELGMDRFGSASSAMDRLKNPDIKGLGVEKTRLRVVKSHDS